MILVIVLRDLLGVIDILKLSRVLQITIQNGYIQEDRNH